MVSDTLLRRCRLLGCTTLLIRLPLYLLAAYGLIVLFEGAGMALGSGVGTELSRGVLKVAGVLWLLFGLRRGHAWAWWLANGGATVFLISVLTALVAGGLGEARSMLPPTLFAKAVLLATTLVLLLLPASRRHYLGRRSAVA